MALKIRLRQQGRANRHSYRVVVTDSRSPRDGRYVEALGWYNPLEAEMEKHLHLKKDRIEHWLNQGAILTERAEALVAKIAPRLIQERKEKELAFRAKRAAARKARKVAA